MIKAVIFDMDGVIVDSEPLHYQAEKAVLARFGLDFTRELHTRYIGYASEQKFWEDLLQGFGVKLDIKELIKQKKDYFYSHLAEVTLIEAAWRLLQWFKSRALPMALASSSNMELIQVILKNFRLESFFSVLQSGEHMKNGKPAPDIFLAAAAGLGAAPADCLVIEDSYYGVQGGRAAGMTVVAVPNAYTRDLDYKAAGADYILTSLDDFPALGLISS